MLTTVPGAACTREWCLITERSTPDLRKWQREPTVSLDETAAKKPEEKRLKASSKEEEWVEVPTRKNLLIQKTQKTEKDVKT